MERWEYFQTSIQLVYGRNEGANQRSLEAFYRTLNGLGAEGWEMVNFHVDSYSTAKWYLMMFKRRLTD